MEYQNKLSRLRHAFLKLQGQDLTQVLLRAAAKEAEYIAENVYTTEEIFRAITDKIYKVTNELPYNTKFELVSDAESLAILKKELIEDTVSDFQWEETLFVLLEDVDEKDKKLMEAVLNNQRSYLEGCSNNHQPEYNLNGTIGKILIPMVRRIYDDLPIKNLVGIQPMTGPVGMVYSLEYRVKDEETGEYITFDEAEEKDTPKSPFTTAATSGRKLQLEIVSNAVEAGSRNLKAGWTMEAAQDLNSLYGIDIESEMTQALSSEVSAEFTNEVIHNLKKLGGDAEVVKLDGSKSEQLMTLGCRIRSNCSAIARTTRRGAGNFIVVSLEMATALKEEKYSDFKPNKDNKFKMSEMLEVGTMNGTIRVFAADVPTDEILVGYKGGNGECDTGYIHCPYIPLMSAGVVVNSKTFEPVVRLMTRYGKFVSDNADAYYRNIKVESDLLVTKPKQE